MFQRRTAAAHSVGQLGDHRMRARTSSLRLVSWVDSVVMRVRMTAGAAVRRWRGTRRRDQANCAGSRAHLGQRGEPASAVERAVLDALGHHHARRLLEPDGSAACRRRSSRSATSRSVAGSSGRRTFARATRLVEMLRAVAAGTCGTRGSKLSSSASSVVGRVGMLGHAAGPRRSTSERRMPSATARFVAWIIAGQSTAGRRRSLACPARPAPPRRADRRSSRSMSASAS